MSGFQKFICQWVKDGCLFEGSIADAARHFKVDPSALGKLRRYKLNLSKDNKVMTHVKGVLFVRQIKVEKYICNRYCSNTEYLTNKIVALKNSIAYYEKLLKQLNGMNSEITPIVESHDQVMIETKEIPQLDYLIELGKLPIPFKIKFDTLITEGMSPELAFTKVKEMYTIYSQGVSHYKYARAVSEQ